jgi:hypothetical protein
VARRLGSSVLLLLGTAGILFVTVMAGMSANLFITDEADRSNTWKIGLVPATILFAISVWPLAAPDVPRPRHPHRRDSACAPWWRMLPRLLRDGHNSPEW